AAGDAHIAGYTRSQFYPTTPGAFQEDFLGEIDGCGNPPFDPIHNCEDMFVTKLLPDGSAFGFSTFVAGHHEDVARAVAVGPDGSVYTVGYTHSDDFPLTDGQGNVVVSKLSASGSDLVYTVEMFSGSPTAGHGLAVGPYGDIYFTGGINVPSDVYVARLSEGPQGPDGDLDGDGCVDLTDLATLLANYGTTSGATYEDGDLDGDGDVDLADLAILLGNYGEGCEDMATIALQFDGVEDLGPDYVYEGWFIVDGMPVSTGRFVVDEDGMPVPDEFEVTAMDAAEASLFVLTIEPAEGDEPEPADTHMLAGGWDGDCAVLTVGHPAALGDDYTSASGAFILETPTTGDIPDDYDQGIWWLDPGAGPGPSLALPELPAGWEFEGWVVGGEGPITTGRFMTPSGEDSDGAGPFAGPDAFPPFPGQDFIDPPMVLTDFAAVITIEPEPDNSPGPFTLKPLIDGNIEDVGPGVLQSMENRAADFPVGMVVLVD
ncbi:MAG: anti-sigma factor, partial [Planctomycetota bacterium]